MIGLRIFKESAYNGKSLSRKKTYTKQNKKVNKQGKQKNLHQKQTKKRNRKNKNKTKIEAKKKSNNYLITQYMDLNIFAGGRVLAVWKYHWEKPNAKWIYGTNLEGSCPPQGVCRGIPCVQNCAAS